MGRRIQILRGIEINLPILTVGEMATTTDTYKIFIGHATKNTELACLSSGTTEERPTGKSIGFPYFDTTLGNPIWFNGTVWKDSTGTTV